MRNTEILSRINALLNRSVKLEQQTLENWTIVEAEVFEVGTQIFAVDGENKEPLPVGEYTMADGSILYVTEAGVIGEIATKKTEEVEEEVPVEAGYKKKQEMAEVPATIEEIIDAVVGVVKPMLDEMQAKIDALSGTAENMKETLSSVRKPNVLLHKPTEKQIQKTKSHDTQALVFEKLANIR